VEKFPKKILIPSDENEMELLRVEKKDKKAVGIYVFTISETKKGMEATYDDDVMGRAIERGIFKPI